MMILFVYLLMLSSARGVLSHSDHHMLNVFRLARSEPLNGYSSEAMALEHLNQHLQNLFDVTSPLHHHESTFIVTTTDAIDPEMMQRLVGPQRFGSFSQGNYRVTLSPLALRRLLNEYPNDILATTPMIPALKLSMGLGRVASSCVDEQLLVVEIAALSHEDHSAFSAWLRASAEQHQFHDISYRALHVETVSRIKLRVPCAAVSTVVPLFAEHRHVLWIEPSSPFKTSNYWARAVTESGLTGVVPLLHHLNFNGAGQVIGISDTGLDIYSNYFYDTVPVTPNVVNPTHRKILCYNTTFGDFSDIVKGHGTHVAGTALGKDFANNASWANFNGMASDAKLVFYDISTDAQESLVLPDDINLDLFVPMYRNGARIFSNSWGGAAPDGYDLNARDADLFMWNYPEALVLFANGNDGDNATNAYTVGSPAIFKNGIAVGATLNDAASWQFIDSVSNLATFAGQNSDSLASFSSRGPTRDGRIKPDILGPGFYINSAYASPASNGVYHSDLTFKAGTSMATPAVAGMAAIIRQYFTSGYYAPNGVFPSGANAFTPSGALLKAMLLASATPIHNIYNDGGSGGLSATSYPSNDQGYGRITVDNVLNFAAATSSPLTLVVIGDVNTASTLYKKLTTGGQCHTYAFSSATTAVVRVVLAYTDLPPSSPSPVMQNKLTLSVAPTAGGSAFSPYLSATSNTEFIVSFTATASVSYTTSVCAQTIVQAQPYALVMLGDVTKVPDTTNQPSSSPSAAPSTQSPTATPSFKPSAPSAQPSTSAPTTTPSALPSTPTAVPTTSAPTTAIPSALPSTLPSSTPTSAAAPSDSAAFGTTYIIITAVGGAVLLGLGVLFYCFCCTSAPTPQYARAELVQ